MFRLIAILFVVLSLTGIAWSGAGNTPTVEAFEFPSAANGKPTGPETPINPDSYNVRGNDIAAFELPAGPTAAPVTAAASGAACKTVYVVRYLKSSLGSNIASFTQTKTFCYGGGVITSTTVKVSGKGISSGWRYCCVSGSSASFYAWKVGQPKSGHWSYRQGKFTNGALSAFAAITIYSHADGSWSYTTA